MPATTTTKQSDHHQAERQPAQQSRSSSPGPYSHGERWSRDDDRPPARREPKPAPEPKPARERTAGRHARPPQKSEARAGSQPSGQDSMIKKYWWVGALGAAGLITLVAVSRK